MSEPAPGAAGEARLVARRAWLRRILAAPPRSAARRAAIDAVVAESGLCRTRVYQLLQACAVEGEEALQRRPRSDRGAARRGPDGVDPTAFRQAAVGWMTHPDRIDWSVAHRLRRFREHWRAGHGDEVPLSDATLRRWLREADPAYPLTRRERRRHLARRLTLTAEYANQVWQGDAPGGEGVREFGYPAEGPCGSLSTCSPTAEPAQ